MFKTFRNIRSIFVIVAIAVFITACGGGSGGSNSDTQPTINQQVFTVVTPNSTTTVQGVGDTVAQRQLNAATIAATVVKPSTADYQLLLSTNGLQLNVVDEQKTAVVYIAKLTASGLYVTIK